MDVCKNSFVTYHHICERYNMAKETKNSIIHFATKLFSTIGVQNTTMAEVARVSGLGRRTIYTHFKSRQELYDVVVQVEVRRLFRRLAKVVDVDVDPLAKLELFIKEHYNCIRDLTNANRAIKRDFLRFDRRVEVLRRDLDIAEQNLIESILQGGLKKSVFRDCNTSVTAKVILAHIKAIEVAVILDRFSEESREMIEAAIELITNGVKK